MKIRTAIYGAYVAASAVGLAVLMRFMLAEVRPRYVTGLRQSLQDSATLVAGTLQGRTKAEAHQLLAAPASFTIRLEAANGEVLFGTPEPPVAGDSEYGSDTGRATIRQAGDRLLDGGAPLSEVEVRAVAPVRLADEPGARLVLSRSFRSVNAVVWSERVKLASVALVIAGAMLLAGWWIAARLTRALERLTDYALAVRDGRPATAPPGSRAEEIAALARAFEQMRDALEGRQHVERYTQALAHEVKAPLAAIQGAAELMQEDMPAEQRDRFLANIRRETARIQQCISRLLELSSLEARKELGRSEVFDAAEVANEAAEVVRPAYAAASVELKLSAVSAKIRGDRVLWREALVNLLRNALDFSAARTVVELTVEQAEGRVRFAVEDRGAGVPDYALNRVFERFYSLPRPGTNLKSTGLGLALVREIAHLHGGDAALVNREGGGARATCWLPAAG